ncbi:hypothetical protein V8E36_000008 [Tilletia maclaganii]
MALPRSAVPLRTLAVRSAAPAVRYSQPAAALSSSSRRAQGGGPSLSGAHHEETHEEYPREDFSGPFFRNVVILGVVAGIIFKISNINENLAASRASSSGKSSSFQDAEHAEKTTKPWITRYLEHHTTPLSEYTDRNAKWLEAAKRTAEDKLLLQDAERPPVQRLRYIGHFDGGSPHGIRPGTQLDLSDLKIKLDDE